MTARSTLTPAISAELAEAAGSAITQPTEMAGYMREWRDRYVGTSPLVVRPGDTDRMARVAEIAARHGLSLVPQGGNTGLVGGQIPERGDEILVSLNRMRRVRELDAASATMTVDAGVTLQEVRDRADAAGFLFPLSLASQGTATMGGVLASNAGGVAVLAYGNARDLVLGLEVVLPDGRVWHGLDKLRKNNTGYDLKHLFVGSEGTLGFITGAVLKLWPKPQAAQTLFLGLPSPEAALALFAIARARAGAELTSFELMPRLGLELAMRQTGERDPLGAPHPWYVLMELTSPRPDAQLTEAAETIFEAAFEDGHVADAAIAQSLDQARAFWALREAMSEAQKLEGGSIKHDVSVPINAIPAFLAEANAAVETVCPGARPVPFGHVGDGNLHYNVSQPVGADKDAYLALWEPMNAAVHAVVARHGGSISAEHGIGRMKRHLLADARGPVAMDMMRAIKAALDPDGRMNPGKLFAPDGKQ